MSELSRDEAESLLTRLVEIPSFSGDELKASAYLVEAMGSLGYDRYEVDAAGNAVGEIGAADAGQTVVLLGHIDTVFGDIPVRVEKGRDGPLLYGRGSVDAKGPLATFAAAAARLGSEWAHRNDTRLVVVGAVEEEAATSKGARFIRDRFDGSQEPVPDFCVIGEPSGATRITLFYMGRILLEMKADQPMMHSAGPNPGVATNAVDLWNWLVGYAACFNRDRNRMFDQLRPSLRELRTWTDKSMRDLVWTKIGIRLPLEFDVDAFLGEMWNWARERVHEQDPPPAPPYVSGADASPRKLHFGDEDLRMAFRFHGYEPAWRSGRNSPLVRGFLAAIREQTSERPRFVSKSGTSDMNVVGPAWQCPIAAYGPGDSSLDHTPHEHLNLDEYWQAVLILESALKRLG
ncbi:MAG: M20/M25/M40 family metallo-hydrolase [Caldilineaceae bacterium SB0661_bin_32]|uniref:Putative [LysW]-lysine hydrolase n=1 Tax=Caldilineaceae bacterium SB0661_bin_32 TaxID=2605255 RepID=A0A6B1D6A9_9CHLR|nr:M20/M25/M40 family metallo-hydrolase [Caldilineaceae bacterium SB0661_bin_32]